MPWPVFDWHECTCFTQDCCVPVVTCLFSWLWSGYWCWYFHDAAQNISITKVMHEMHIGILCINTSCLSFYFYHYSVIRSNLSFKQCEFCLMMLCRLHHMGKKKTHTHTLFRLKVLNTVTLKMWQIVWLAISFFCFILSFQQNPNVWL
jgi:hypothetical protein